MFTYRPVDVTSHLSVSICVFRWSKCCALHNNMFYVFFCLIAHSAVTINWVLHVVPLMITHLVLLLLINQW
jgi:hypothetical protein